jgi:hypothetical protein
VCCAASGAVRGSGSLIARCWLPAERLSLQLPSPFGWARMLLLRCQRTYLTQLVPASLALHSWLWTLQGLQLPRGGLVGPHGLSGRRKDCVSTLARPATTRVREWYAYAHTVIISGLEAPAVVDSV